VGCDELVPDGRVTAEQPVGDLDPVVLGQEPAGDRRVDHVPAASVDEPHRPAARATGKAAVVVAGARAGQQMRAFQQLPAGTTSYVIYGLNEALNYCFSVVAADSPGRLDTAEEACTHRP
jgi:hypothetical protein